MADKKATPFEKFLSRHLVKFEEHLEKEGLKPGVRKMRLRGARQFIALVSGRPARKGERLK